MNKYLINKSLGFTLLEILIVITLITLLVIAIVVFLDPLKQITKAQDSRRKNDLAKLQKVFEDYYNDKGCYPKPVEVCYNPNGNNPCNICGNELKSPNFSPYLNTLPCDPQHPVKKYLYQAEDTNCPRWFRIYSNLGTKWSRESDTAGCGKGGCGPSPNYGYDYGTSSPNVSLQKTPSFYCCTTTNTCDNCSGTTGDYNYCYINPVCKKIYPTNALCLANCY